MQDSQYDADEARAHIILLRDGLEKIDSIFEKTKSIPKKYIRKYFRIARLEDLAQVAYTAHILAIQTFPVNSSVNFFGWASHTIRREIIDFIREQKRYRMASERAKKSGQTLLGSCEHPETEYLQYECTSMLNRAINSLGEKNRQAVIEKFANDDGGYFTESYFKRKKRVEHSLARLSSCKALKDYL
jgi:RNA polymerase sigma factor (sigma-70 family)